MIATILDPLQLNPAQAAAAFARDADIAVLAGAGCGKTKTLVARFLFLLTEGLEPQEIVTITFTERAGQEMRVRIRQALRDHLATHPADEAVWQRRYMALDSAPIGTIHGFCSRLLRAHPAEAGIDPGLGVLEEGGTARLLDEAVQRVLAVAVRQSDMLPCFDLFGEGLGPLLLRLLGNRLAVGPALQMDITRILPEWRAAPLRLVQEAVQDPGWAEACRTLQECVPADASDLLNAARLAALAATRRAEGCLAEGNWRGALDVIWTDVKPSNKGQAKAWDGRKGDVQEALRSLCTLRDRCAALKAADPEIDEQVAAAWPRLAMLYAQAEREYGTLKAEQQGLDFDDLEARALLLLQTHPEVAAYERARCRALLVDEFQDTNDRQRELVEALLGARAGQSGRLFVVGDAKQSIYRFRGADVTVFVGVERGVQAAGGVVQRLDETYRTHAGLLSAMNRLLEGAMAHEGGPSAGHWVPFAALTTTRKAPQSGVRPPFVEFQLGWGAKAGPGRQAAAGALAARLRELHDREQVPWRGMACLFRASRSMRDYEDAFGREGIPYVTVAGAGFYDRPEVRDLLNALRAVADPNDDAALAGFLRSPAVGLSDAALLRLRPPGSRNRRLVNALRGGRDALPPEEQARAGRAAELLEHLHAQVGRLPVAAVLKELLDETAYPAMLRLRDHGERARLNVEKLLADAHRSGLVSVGDFVDYVQGLRDVAAREGEAPPEAGEAVQLMTVHRAKGLEFNVVALCDAAHGRPSRGGPYVVHPEWGLCLQVTQGRGDDKRVSPIHALACALEGDLDEAEDRRLLYVALTRAKDKLIVSGALAGKADKPRCDGWLDLLDGALDHELSGLPVPPPGTSACRTLWDGELGCTLYSCPDEDAPEAGEEHAAAAPTAGEPAEPAPDLSFALAAPYEPDATARLDPGERREAARPVRRVLPGGGRVWAPQAVVGELVHLGMRAWLFAGPELEAMLRAAAANEGLVDRRQIDDGVHKALDLLARFRRSPVFAALDGAERIHELPFVYPGGDEPAGRIDLLCREAGGGWRLVDFKTDRLKDRTALEGALAKHRAQLRRYARALEALLGLAPQLQVCFLDYDGTVELIDVS